MEHFSIRIDRFRTTASVFLNGRPVGIYSPLSRCAAAPFAAWMADLPDMLCRESNGPYALAASGPPFLCRLLQSRLENEPLCQSLQVKPDVPAFGAVSRLVWAQQAAQALHSTLPKRTVLWISAPPALQNAIRSMPMPALPLAFGTGAPGSTLYLVRSRQELPAGVQAAYCIGDHEVRAEQQPSLLYASGRLQDFPAFVAEYYDCCFDRPYLLEARQRLLPLCSAQTDFPTRASVEMLLQDEPVVRFTAPARAEAGSMVNCRIECFPPGVRLCLKARPPGIVSEANGGIRANAVGTTTLQLFAENSGQVLAESTVEVYTVRRVRSLLLSAPGGETTILQGSSLHIRSSFQPANAENLHLAKWSVSDHGVLAMVSPGVFRAAGHGHCRVTLCVEQVSASLDITVLPLAADIQLPASIELKLHDAPFPVSGQLLPPGAACKSILCRTADPAVAGWDDASKSVFPVAEGTTQLEVSITDANGKVIQQRYCEIHILPDEPIVTPDPFMAFLLLTAFFVLLTVASALLPLALALFLGCSCWHLYRRWRGPRP